MKSTREKSVTSETKRAAGPTWKRLFFRGLALLLPTVVTAWLLVQAYVFVEGVLIYPVNAGIRALLKAVGFYRFFGAGIDYAWAVKWLVVAPVRWFFENAFGIIISVLLLCVVGLAVGTFLGRRLWNVVEKRMDHVPLVRFVYPFVREVTDFVFTERKVAFHAVVLVQYPREGIWAVGFVTGQGFDALEKSVGKPLVSVFVPCSPTPMTGYLVFVPSEDVVALDISIDDAFRLIMSGGVIVPGAPKSPPATAGATPASPAGDRAR